MVVTLKAYGEGEEGRNLSLGKRIDSIIRKEFVNYFSGKPTLLCMVWTKKLYNLDNFRAQLKIIWKTRKKFEIQVARQNLFMVLFEDEEDLETILEGRS